MLTFCIPKDLVKACQFHFRRVQRHSKHEQQYLLINDLRARKKGYRFIASSQIRFRIRSHHKTKIYIRYCVDNRNRSTAKIAAYIDGA